MKIIYLSMLAALSAVALSGCTDTGGGNANLANKNSNVAVVINSNSNMANSNGMNSNMANTSSNIGKSVSSADTEFMNKAAQGGMAEVKLGAMAAEKAQSADVKSFGQKMVTDHSKATDELKTVAAGKNMTLPADVNAEQKAMMDKLAKLSGAAFDKEYVKGMVEDHEKDVADFQKQSDKGDDADVKSFATKTLPTLKSHLEMIKGIQGKMK